MSVEDDVVAIPDECGDPKPAPGKDGVAEHVADTISAEDGVAEHIVISDAEGVQDAVAEHAVDIFSEGLGGRACRRGWAQKLGRAWNGQDVKETHRGL